MPLKEETKVLDAEFKRALAAKITQLTVDFKSEFWIDGQINWAKFAKLTSAVPEPKAPKPPRVPKPRIPRRVGNSRRKKNASVGNQPTLLPEATDV